MSPEKQEIIEGLMATKAFLSPKYFYDQIGSKLFEDITQLPEYYLTRTEKTIFDRERKRLVETLGHSCVLIDVGAGNCEKAEQLFEDLRPSHYIPVDISSSFLTSILDRLRRHYPSIHIQHVEGDFTKGLRMPADIPEERRVVFFPGSTIGNFTPSESIGLLKQLRNLAGPEGICLIGIDLAKETAIIEAAYNDNLGITAAFNKNILQVANQTAGTNFDPEDWDHVAFFNKAESRIEMHLEARCKQAIHWREGVRSFEQGERIHTENSYKYTLEAFDSLLAKAGLSSTSVLLDENQWFSLILARPLCE